MTDRSAAALLLLYMPAGVIGSNENEMTLTPATALEAEKSATMIRMVHIIAGR